MKIRFLLATTLLFCVSLLMAQPTLIGYTTYDLQTNRALQRRLLNHGNGQISAIWTYSNDVRISHPRRGTGYNYFDGTNWQTDPTDYLASGNFEAIEKGQRTGWPSIVKTDSFIEVVTAHTSSGGGITYNQFTTKQHIGNNFLTRENRNSFDADTWGRAAASRNIVVHIIGRQAGGSSPQEFNRVTGGLAMYRSIDGGDSFSSAQIIDGMDTSNFTRIFPDQYTIDANSNGVFGIVCESFTGSYFKSVDFGETWVLNKIQRNIPQKMSGFDDDFQFGEELLFSDGSFNTIVDETGLMHVVYGKLLARDKNDGTDGTFNAGPMGICYWNENMLEPILIPNTLPFPEDGVQLKSSILNNRVIQDRDYNVAPVSMPSIGIDSSGNIYVSYSAVDEARVEPLSGAINRSTYLIKSSDNGASWQGPINVMGNTVLGDTSEVIFGHMAKGVDSFVHIITQVDRMPGSIIQEDSAEMIPHNYPIEHGVYYHKIAVDSIVNLPHNPIEKPVITDRFEPILNNPNEHHLVVPFGCDLQTALFNLYPAYDRQDGRLTQYDYVDVDASNPFNPTAAGTYTINIFALDTDGNSTDTMPRQSILFNPPVEGLIVKVEADTTAPELTLEGKTEICLLNEVFIEPGFNAIDNSPCFHISDVVVDSGGYAPNLPGTYTFTYTATDVSGNSVSRQRIVHVIDQDTVAPEIIFPQGDTFVHEACNFFSKPLAFGLDCVDGEINTFETEDLIPEQLKTLGFHELPYTITDASGNSNTKNLIVQIIDTTAPNISLIGSDTTLFANGVYVELGAKASDCVDSNLNVTIAGDMVDTDVSSTTAYFVDYICEDFSGNLNMVSRRVVIDASFNIKQVDLSTSLNLYPNPAQQFIQVDLPKQHDFDQAQIFSLDGSLITKIKLQSFTNQLKQDVSDLPSGNYWLKFKGAKTKGAVQFSVQY